jgi:hypothetical protein
MRRSPLVFIAAALFLGIVVAGVFYYRYQNAPRTALHQMVNALTHRNYKIFYTYLDLKSILGNLMQETGQDLISPVIPENNYLGQLGWKMGRKFAQQVLPRLFEAIEQDLRKLINQYLNTLTTKEFLALKAAVTLAEIRQQGDEAKVILRFSKEGSRLRLTMSKNAKDRNWRVVSVSYEDLKKLVSKELME